MARARIALLFAAILVATSVHGVLYKWTDADGKTQYSDRPPASFTGVVTRIEADAPVTPSPIAPKATAAEAAKPAVEPVVDMATRRRETREMLRANVDRARLKVEEAKKALQEAQDLPNDDERQIIQQRVAGRGNTGTAPNVRNPDATQGRVTGGGMHGMAARANCREARGADGKIATICPSSVLRPEYFERITRLEEALRKAEDELELAQTVYRRNVD
jgi:hypothetical protein